MKSKANLASRIGRLEIASGAKDHTTIGYLTYDQPTMKFTYKDAAYNVDGLTKLFKETPYLFLLCDPTSESYKAGYCDLCWVVGEHFSQSRYMAVEDFIEYLERPPEPIDHLRGEIFKNE